MDLPLIGLDYASQIYWSLGLAVVWGAWFELSQPIQEKWCSSQKWWPAAIDNQRRLLYNFGYPKKPDPPMFPQGTSDAVCLEGFAMVNNFVFQHAIAGGLMVPVCFLGWEASGPWVRFMFIFGGLNDVGLDIYHVLVTTIKAFHGAIPSIGWKSAAPKPFWFIMCILHHPLALSMIIPMNINYPHLWGFNWAATSLLFAAAVCFGTGQVKLALNIKKVSEFRAFQGIVLFQLIVITTSRVFIWFPAVYNCLTTFYAAGDTSFLIGGALAGGLMSLFNMILMADAVGAAVKWLPHKPPTTAHEIEVVTIGLVRSNSSVGFISPTIVNHVNLQFQPRKLPFNRSASLLTDDQGHTKDVISDPKKDGPATFRRAHTTLGAC